MIAAKPGGCNPAVDHTTRGLTMPEEDGSGHPGTGKIGRKQSFKDRCPIPGSGHSLRVSQTSSVGSIPITRSTFLPS
jgi:hypothetical protein